MEIMYYFDNRSPFHSSGQDAQFGPNFWMNEVIKKKSNNPCKQDHVNGTVTHIFNLFTS